MTHRNPWVDSSPSTDVRERAQMQGEDWREWLPNSAPTPGTSADGIE